MRKKAEVYVVERMTALGWFPLIDPYASRSEKQTAIQMRHYVRYMKGVPEVYRVVRYVRQPAKKRKAKGGK